jgi:hypothetical protein
MPEKDKPTFTDKQKAEQEKASKATQNANLQLCNLISSGMSMKDAKKKLGTA